jgi:phosphonate transport system ATP-binding protein
MCNLHTLDTARAYCDRVIGMSAGRVVFDGPPADLDDTIVREVYGVDGEDGEFDEAVTSTAIPFARPAPAGDAASRPVPTHRDGASEPRRKAVND